MAINNGNTDFGLLASFDGRMGIKVSWNKASGIGFNGQITVIRPGDGKTVFHKEYVDTATKSDSFTVQAPYYGEYKIHIKSNNSQTYDIAYCKVILVNAQTSTYTFTAEDVLKWKASSTAYLVLMTALGGVVWARVGWMAGSLVFGTELAGIAMHDTSFAPWPAPSKGDTITTRIEPVSGGVKKTQTYLQANGGTHTPKVHTIPYLTTR